MVPITFSLQVMYLWHWAHTACTNALDPEALARASALSPKFGRFTTSWPSGSPVAGRFSADILLGGGVFLVEFEGPGSWERQKTFEIG